MNLAGKYWRAAALQLAWFLPVGGCAAPADACGDSGEDSTGGSFVPKNGTYDAFGSVEPVLVGDCGTDAGSDVLDPVYWEPNYFSVEDSAENWFKMHFRWNGSDYVINDPLLKCTVNQTGIHEFECASDDEPYSHCNSTGSMLMANFGATGHWDSATTVTGTFTYELEWRGSIPSYPCVSPCVTSWTFDGAWVGD